MWVPVGNPGRSREAGASVGRAATRGRPYRTTAMLFPGIRGRPENVSGWAQGVFCRMKREGALILERTRECLTRGHRRG